jgi:hypothetical protein
MKVISFSRTVSLDILYGEGLKTALILNAGQKYILQDTYVKGLQDRYPYYHDHLRGLSDPASYFLARTGVVEKRIDLSLR